METTFLPILLTLCTTTTAAATHNRAGHIFYRQIDNPTVEATVVTWTREREQPCQMTTKEVENSQD